MTTTNTNDRTRSALALHLSKIPGIHPLAPAIFARAYDPELKHADLHLDIVQRNGINRDLHSVSRYRQDAINHDVFTRTARTVWALTQAVQEEFDGLKINRPLPRLRNENLLLPARPTGPEPVPFGIPEDVVREYRADTLETRRTNFSTVTPDQLALFFMSVPWNTARSAGLMNEIAQHHWEGGHAVLGRQQLKDMMGLSTGTEVLHRLTAGRLLEIKNRKSTTTFDLSPEGAAALDHFLHAR